MKGKEAKILRREGVAAEGRASRVAVSSGLLVHFDDRVDAAAVFCTDEGLVKKKTGEAKQISRCRGMGLESSLDSFCWACRLVSWMAKLKLQQCGGPWQRGRL